MSTASPGWLASRRLATRATWHPSLGCSGFWGGGQLGACSRHLLTLARSGSQIMFMMRCCTLRSAAQWTVVVSVPCPPAPQAVSPGVLSPLPSLGCGQVAYGWGVLLWHPVLPHPSLTVLHVSSQQADAGLAFRHPCFPSRAPSRGPLLTFGEEGLVPHRGPVWLEAAVPSRPAGVLQSFQVCHRGSEEARFHDRDPCPQGATSRLE